MSEKKVAVTDLKDVDYSQKTVLDLYPTALRSKTPSGIGTMPPMQTHEDITKDYALQSWAFQNLPLLPHQADMLLARLQKDQQKKDKEIKAKETKVELRKKQRKPIGVLTRPGAFKVKARYTVTNGERVPVHREKASI